MLMLASSTGPPPGGDVVIEFGELFRLPGGGFPWIPGWRFKEWGKVISEGGTPCDILPSGGGL